MSDALARTLAALDHATASSAVERLALLGYRSLPERRRRAIVAKGMRRQARVCRNRDSELYGRLLAQVAADVEAGGPCWRAVRDEMPRRTALPLRFMGAVHRLVLAGEAPRLSRHYPSAGGGDTSDPWPAFRETVDENVDHLQALVAQPNQTNEVRRCATLLCGFLLVGAETGLPLRLLELGASAGLLLRWDRYRYEAPAGAWGPPESPLVLDNLFSEECPLLETRVEVVERRGCDPVPIDAGAPDSALTLRSLVWADQVDRLRTLEAALAVAAEVPVALDRATASDWLPRHVEQSAPGAATVVFQSYVQQFYTPAAAARIRSTVHAAGARASREAPLAWMRLEPEGGRLVLRLALWPGGDERVVASCTHHGEDARWLLAGSPRVGRQRPADGEGLTPSA